MIAIVVIAAVLGIAYVLKRKPDVLRRKPATVLPVEPEFPLWIEHGFPEPKARLPMYSPGVTFHHKDTGEKVEVLQAPEIVNGEYKIRWPSGAIGYIHESSFKEFFE